MDPLISANLSSRELFEICRVSGTDAEFKGLVRRDPLKEKKRYFLDCLPTLKCIVEELE